MDLQGEMVRVLSELDVPSARRLWAHAAPHLPQPKDDREALVTLHLARTRAKSVPDRLRCYSHHWLKDHGYPSHLPDKLKPMADRLYPRVVKGVGVAVRMRDGELAAAGLLIRGAMEDAIYEAEADGRLDDDEHVRRRMQEARAREKRALFGRFHGKER